MTRTTDLFFWPFSTLCQQLGSKLQGHFTLANRTGLIVVMLFMSWVVGASPTTETTNRRVETELDNINRVTQFLERRIQGNSQDIIAHNRLANLYLQRWRKNRDKVDLDLALSTAQSSIKAVPAEHNAGALAAIALIELENHQFISSRDHAQQLIEIDSNNTSFYLILYDALVELGSYGKADAALIEAKKRLVHSKIRDIISIEIRLAHQALLYGNVDHASKNYDNALVLLKQINPVPTDTIAWCQWRLGEIEFSHGHYEKAEKYYRSAILVTPKSIHILESLGRIRAALGDLKEATMIYERAATIQPDMDLLAMLGDLYQLSGRMDEAKKLYVLAETIGLQAGAIEHRNLAMFYANHDIRVKDAYSLAQQDYDLRPDIYAADVLAWTALKAGDLSRAQSAIVAALRLDTKDAKLFYHAGMIALAANDHTNARAFLTKAQQLNPGFDLLQASVVNKTLAQLKSE